MDWRTGCTRSTVPITQKHPVALVNNTHVIWSDVTRNVAPPCSGLARPAGVSLRRPRSAVENVADLRGSRCGPPGSQMETTMRIGYRRSYPFRFTECGGTTPEQ